MIHHLSANTYSFLLLPSHIWNTYCRLWRHCPWEWQTRKAHFCSLKVFLFCSFLGEKECSSSCFKDSELCSFNNSKLFWSKGQSFNHTGRIGKLDETKFILSFFILIFSTISYSKIDNNSTLMSNFKKWLQTTDFDFIDGMNPYGTIQAILIKVFNSF